MLQLQVTTNMILRGKIRIQHQFATISIIVFRQSTFYCNSKSMPVYEWNQSMHTYKVNEIAQTVLESSESMSSYPN